MADYVEIDQVRSNKGSYSFLNTKLVKLQVTSPPLVLDWKLHTIVHTLLFANP